MVDVIVPRRKEDWFTNNGDLTLRALRFFESLTDTTNDSSDIIANLDQTDSAVLISQLNDLIDELNITEQQRKDADDSEIGFNDDPIVNVIEDVDSDEQLFITLETTRDATATSVDYLTSVSEIVICTDVVTVTLNATPDDQEFSTIKSTNGNVIIDGNGKNVDADPTVTIVKNYTTLDIIYLAELDGWFII